MASHLESYLSTRSFSRMPHGHKMDALPPASHQLSPEEGGESEEEEGRSGRGGETGGGGERGKEEAVRKKGACPDQGVGASQKPPPLSPPSLSDNTSFVGTGKCRF